MPAPWLCLPCHTSVSHLRPEPCLVTGPAGAGRRYCRRFIPSATQFTYFACLLGGGLVFLSLSFFVFLPIIIIAPSKFALTFTLGEGGAVQWPGLGAG